MASSSNRWGDRVDAEDGELLPDILKVRAMDIVKQWALSEWD